MDSYGGIKNDDYGDFMQPEVDFDDDTDRAQADNTLEVEYNGRRSGNADDDQREQYVLMTKKLYSSNLLFPYNIYFFCFFQILNADTAHPFFPPPHSFFHSPFPLLHFKLYTFFSTKFFFSAS